MEIIREVKVADFSAADCSWCETEAWCNWCDYDRGTSKDMMAWKAWWAKYGTSTANRRKTKQERE